MFLLFCYYGFSLGYSQWLAAMPQSRLFCPCWEGEGLTRQMLCVCWWFPCLRSVLGQSRGCWAQRSPCDRDPDVGQKWCNLPPGSPLCPTAVALLSRSFGACSSHYWGRNSLFRGKSAAQICPSVHSPCLPASPWLCQGTTQHWKLSVLGMEGPACPWVVRN